MIDSHRDVGSIELLEIVSAKESGTERTARRAEELIQGWKEETAGELRLPPLLCLRGIIRRELDTG